VSPANCNIRKRHTFSTENAIWNLKIASVLVDLRICKEILRSWYTVGPTPILAHAYLIRERVAIEIRLILGVRLTLGFKLTLRKEVILEGKG